MFACQANISKAEHSCQRFDKRSDYFIASVENDFPDSTAELLQATASVSEVKPPKERKSRADKFHAMFEFCCSEDSMLGQVNLERGINHFRLTKKSSNMADNQEVNDLLKVMKLFPGADLWGSIPCDPWCSWQYVNCAKHGEPYRRKLALIQKKSRNFIRCAVQILAQWGHVAFEWPRGSRGWALPELVKFIRKHNLFVAEPDGCALDMKDDQGVPDLKHWRVVTSSYRLARNLGAHKCEHPKGSSTRGWKAQRPQSQPFTPRRCVGASATHCMFRKCH